MKVITSLLPGKSQRTDSDGRPGRCCETVDGEAVDGQNLNTGYGHGKNHC